MTDTDIKKGLAGVVVDTTSISKVNPETNSLLYRGYPVQELAASLSYEQVAWLIWHGELPTEAELAEFTARERAGRALADNVKAAIDLTPTSSHPMDVVRTAVSVLGANDPQTDDSSREANLAKSERLFAAIPAIVAYDQRRRHGLDVVAPRDDLDYSRNFLWMTFGDEPSDAAAEVFRVSMVLYAEHSFNASTFTARVVTSTLADLHSAVVAAIGALKGPLHGGANEAVMDVFDEIGSADGAEAWLDAALAEKRKIMGFGHRVYKNGDSRVPTMQAAFEKLVESGEFRGVGGAEVSAGRGPDLVALYHRLADAMEAKKSIKPNLDYPSGPAYHLLGFDTKTFTPLFVASRVVGWTAHVMEQLEANALIRPLSEYVGPDERHLQN
ncbi:bifunctional 2-methylcitrate synthase/citrate synthase [Schumannella luteola]|uniref:Citrate synthase n=1 Tax=Schumannella luteola TaxID=472059 RepID=A0A852YEG6_9MICO|nr:bifunctional 2-methylcitrate synthase/citrate synthase [Schumannella luteola]NYG97508.1 citrate synthase/2-methylcitrate synthase [Schumannella luteola]TPX01531.1 bifunctional 2-methylcitrate synthase/citrate synthase [Schumannella luteola]